MEEHHAKELSYDQVSTEKLMHYYFDERISTLKCLSVLLRIEGDNTHPYHEQASQTLTKLFADDLEGKVFEQLDVIAAGVKQEGMEHTRRVLWSNQQLNEFEALLEVFFLFYYSRIECDDAAVLILAKFFEKIEFGLKLVHPAYLDTTGRATVSRIRFLINLILIEALQLEAVLPDDASVALHKVLCGSARSELETLLVGWTLSNPHAAATSLAFVALRCREGHLKLPPVEYPAVPTGPGLVQIHELASNDDFLRESPNLLAYKSVVRGLMCVLVKVFDVGSFPQQQYELIVDIACKIYTNMPGLCSQFWDDMEDGMRVLLSTMRMRFPLEISPMLKLLTALAADEYCAENVFYYLQQFDTITHYVAVLSANAYTEEAGTSGAFMRIVPTTQPLDRMVVGMCLPVGTTGSVVSGDIGQMIVSWQVAVNPWALFFAAIDVYLSPAPVLRPDILLEADVTDILQLLAQLFAQLPKLAHVLSEQLRECATMGLYTFRSDYPAEDVVHRVFAILFACAGQSPVSLRLLTACARTAAALARAVPNAVAVRVARASIFSSASSHAPPLMRNLLHSVEFPAGEYPLTLAFLELLGTLLRWQQAAAVTEGPMLNATIDLAASLARVRSDVLAEYDGWRYVRILDRWNIGCHALKIVKFVIEDARVEQVGSLPHSLVMALLTDSSLHHTLFTAIGNGPAAIEKRFDSRNVEEGKALEKLIVLAFSVVEFALHWKAANTADTSVAPLEAELLSRKGHDSMDLVTIIAEYIHYPYHSEVQLPALPLLATRVTTLLCRLAVRVRTRPPSIVSYWGAQAKTLRKAFLDRLNNRRESDSLRVAVLEMITTALETQPGLAELFINLPPKAVSGSTEPVQPDMREDSCLYFVMRQVREAPQQMMYRSRLVSHSLALLYALWQVAADHEAIVGQLRKQDSFWSELVQPLQPEGGSIGPADETDASDCYRTTARAWVLRLLALELFYSRSSPTSALRKQLEALSNGASYQRFVKEYVTSSFRPDPIQRFEEMCQQVHTDVKALRTRGRRDFGTAYIYDVTLINKTFAAAAVDTYDAGARAAAGRELIALAKEANLMWSRVDAELLLLRSVREFVQVASLRQHLAPKNKLVTLPFELIMILANELRDNADLSFVAQLGRAEKASTLLILLRSWTTAALNDALLGGTSTYGRFRQQAIEIIERLVPSLVRAVDDSVLAPKATKPASVTETQLLSGPDGDLVVPDIRLSLLSAMLIASKFAMKLRVELGDHLHPKVHAMTMSMLAPVSACVSQRELTSAAVGLLSVICNQERDDEWVGAMCRSSLLYDLIAAIPATSSAPTLDDVTRTQAVIAFLYSLVRIPAAAEALATSGLMTQLSSPLLYFGNAQPYAENDERNEMHRTWCQTLLLVSGMLRTLGHSERFLEQVMEFISVHRVKIMSCLRFSSGLIVTLAGLEELERVAELVIELSRFWQACQFIMPDGADAIQSSVVAVFQTFVVLLQSGTQLDAVSKPVSKVEHQALALQERPSTTRVAPVSPTHNASGRRSPSPVPFQRHRDVPSPTPFAKASPTPASDDEPLPFYIQIESALYRVLKCTLTIIRHLSPAALIDNHQVEGLDSQAPQVLHPSLKTPGLQDPPSLGTVILCMHLCLHNFEWCKDPRIKERQSQLIFIYENCIYVLLTHVTLLVLRRDVSRQAKAELLKDIRIRIDARRAEEYAADVVQLLNTALKYIGSLEMPEI
eukprot:TRINITY_DN7939_c0_g1_i1.p1 TRINITY_DN7939_c0_g1~~TRINITY_DN7939_c0_g1_i1.p1  ORF type:complete len:1865 (-),score=337.65 TRINITY_DN7939_c0_g1_i1:1772-6928(-)